MSDRERRYLERELLRGGPDARVRGVMSRLRSGDPVGRGAVEFRLAARNCLFELERQHPFLPKLFLGPVLDLVRRVSDGGEELLPGLRCDFAEIGRNGLTRQTVLVLVLVWGERVFVGFGVSHSARPSPGTVWRKLRPWKRGKAETRAKKLEEWVSKQSHHILETSLGSLHALFEFMDIRNDALFWASLVPVIGVDLDVVNDDISDLDPKWRITRRQQGLIRHLKYKLRISDEIFKAFLREHGGVSCLENMQKRDASTLIDQLEGRPLGPVNDRPDSASNKQSRFIKSLCERKGRDINEVCEYFAGKTEPTGLTRDEASVIIDALLDARKNWDH